MYCVTPVAVVGPIVEIRVWNISFRFYHVHQSFQEGHNFMIITQLFSLLYLDGLMQIHPLERLLR